MVLTIERSQVPATLGSSVDQVLREFISQADAWVGIYVVEATLAVAGGRPAVKYRVAGPKPFSRRTRIGISTAEGWCLREATAAEVGELEDGVRHGLVQIERYRSRGGARQVLHQATGRPIALIPAEVRR